MIVKLIIADDITLNVDISLRSYMHWRDVNSNSNKNIEEVLNSFIKDMDCTKVLPIGRPMTTNNFKYIEMSGEYFYLMYKLDNYILQNTYLDRFIKRHADNIIFERDYNAREVEVKQTNKKKPTKKRVTNKYTRELSKDMFTGEVTYIYENMKTGDVIVSSNPNLLDELNAKKKKTKKSRVASVSMDAMTFSFKK